LSAHEEEVDMTVEVEFDDENASCFASNSVSDIDWEIDDDEEHENPGPLGKSIAAHTVLPTRANSAPKNNMQRRGSLTQSQSSQSKMTGPAVPCIDVDTTEDGAEWVKVSGNAFGAFIHVGLQSGLTPALINCGPMVVASLLIQGIFAEELISQHLPILTEKEALTRVIDRICWVPVKLQISAVLIFITLMFHNIPGMLQATRITLYSIAHQGGEQCVNISEEDDIRTKDEDSSVPRHPQPLYVSSFSRQAIFVAAVLTEILSWGAILMAGILFAFTSETTDLVIRSAVSVMFVLNVDEIVFAACCPSSVASNMECTTYKVSPIQKYVEQKTGISAATRQLVTHYYGLYGHLSLMILFTTVVITSLRVSVLECHVHPWWQVAHVKNLAPWPAQD